jgi:hypothetical protein
MQTNSIILQKTLLYNSILIKKKQLINLLDYLKKNLEISVIKF